MRRLSIGLLWAVVCFLSLLGGEAHAQNYVNAVGNPSFGVNLPVPNGYINVANGNLHLEIPLATHKQRGALQLNERLIYDSRIWEIVQYNNYYWWPLNVPNSQAGWRFVKGNETGTTAVLSSQIQNTSCWTGIYNQPYTITTSYYSWADPNGTVHPFDASSTTENVPTNCPGTQGGTFTTTSNGYATDASGYFATLTSDAYGNVSITIRDSGGAQVYPQVIDRFGNFWTNDSNNNLVDDLGRTPVITTMNGNTTYYDVLAPNGPISNGGTRVRYTVTMGQITINTAFNQQGVTEYQGNGNPPGSVSKTIPAVQSVGLPDGSSYQFSYDSYGEIQSMTLPTGGVVGYGWTNYNDSYLNVNRWLSSSTIAGISTLYTPSVLTQCSSNGTGCKEQVNVHRPSGDETVYTMTLDNGAWDTNTTVYSGAASANQAKLATVTTYDFSHPCNSAVCNGAKNVTKATTTDSLPDATVSALTQTIYSNPASGQLTSLLQWDFYPSGSTPSTLPTRRVNYGFTGFDLTSETHLDSGGVPAASTTYNYASAATATSGVVGHGNANAGGPYLTSVTVTNKDASASVTTSAAYEDTGSLLNTTDARTNVTGYKYDSTHTFVTEVDRPSTVTNGTTYQHVSKAAFDPNSGAILSSDDENSVANGQANTVRYSYESLAGRLQTILSPKAVPTDPAGGSTAYSYPSANEIDVTVAQTPTVNLVTASIVDGYGRASQSTTGGISSVTTYDGNGRVYSVTNPTNGSATTNGTVYQSYDVLDRVSSVQNQDGTVRYLQVTGNIATATDEIGNQSKQVFNVFGSPVSVFEADPNTGSLTFETDYTYDGLGNVTCIEQHGGVSGTGCSGTSDSTSPWRVRRFFYNYLSQLVAANIPEHMFLPSHPASQNCGSGTSGTWTDCYVYDANGNSRSHTDNRSVTRSTTYDALNRPLLTTSPNGTTQNLAYDAGVNGVGYLWYGSNDINAAATYGFDTLGRRTSESSCRPSNCGAPYVPIGATYDLAGNRTSITYPDGRIVGTQYDSLNRIGSVSYQAWGQTTVNSTYWSATSYAAPGLLQAAAYGNGVQMQSTFNSRLSLTALNYQSTNVNPTQTFFNKTYKWDSNAVNLLNESNLVNSQQRSFGYDKLNRLVSAADVTSSAAYATGTATVTGVEGSTQSCGGLTPQSAPKTAAATTKPSPAVIGVGCTTVWDTGQVTLTVGSYSVSTPYAKGSTSATIASNLARHLNASGSPVTATASGTTITMTSVILGAAGNYALSYYSDGDFNLSFSGATMTGGSGSTPIPGGLNQQYTLDAWGNLSSMGTSGFNLSINVQNQVGGFNYDAAGRLLNDSMSYSYDDDGMLTSSSDGTSYVYDALKARAQVSNGGASKEYYYFDGLLVATLNPALGSGGWTDYIYAGGQKIAVVAGNRAATPVYTLPDHLGSEVASIDPNQRSAAALDYTPFGQVISGSSTDPFIFTGLERDSTGLDHAGFRQYSSSTARWTTPDPYDGSYDARDPQSFNRYTYARNNPLAFTDLSGLQSSGACARADCGPGGGGGGCYICILVPIATFGISEWMKPTFNGNVAATHGPGLQSRVNADGSINASAVGPDGTPTGGGTGYFGGFYYVNGDPRQAPNKRMICTGSAYVLAGNPANIGQTGFPNTTVTNGSAAVIPRQFTGQFAGGPFMRQIGASTFGTVTGPNGATESFNTITQAVGNAALGTALQAQNIIMGRDPGALVIEIVGGANTWKNAGVTLNMPSLGQGCPAGTRP